MYKIISIFFLLLLTTIFVGCKNNKAVLNPTVIEPVIDRQWGFETTANWADEFNNTGKPLTINWDYNIGGSGWGNNEKQFYTDYNSNVNVANGNLTITAKKENLNGMSYSSTRLVSKNLRDILYGRIEVKAKLPLGRGTWPAIWMMPTDDSYGNWPKSGEIDIMEHVGFDQDKVHFTVHTEAYNHIINTQKGNSKVIVNASTTFNLYRVDWTPFAVRGYFNDQKVFEFVIDGLGYKTWPFNKRFT